MYRMGWVPDPQDPRDYQFDHLAAIRRVGLAMTSLPAKVDLRAGMPAIYNQGNLNSCAPHATAAAVNYEYTKQGIAGFDPSRLFIYYTARALDRSLPQDDGTTLRSNLKAVAWKGVCHEALWPYSEATFNNKPKMALYHDALPHRAMVYESLMSGFYTPVDLSRLRATLAAGVPVIFGLVAFENIYDDSHVDLNALNYQALGGHAVLACGYDDANQEILFRNSWGATWGDQGYGTMAYDYLTYGGLVGDFWVIRKME